MMQIDMGNIWSFIKDIIAFIKDIIIKHIIAFLRQPKLKILPFDPDKDLRTWNYLNTKWERKVATLHIKNEKDQRAKDCVAILKILSRPPNVTHLETQYYLHWADVNYSIRTNAPQPVDILKGQRRLDVVFSQKDQQIPGCWIAIPVALSQAQPKQNQAYLPPGEYQVEVIISCEYGKGDKRKYKIISPEDWQSLNMNQIE